MTILRQFCLLALVLLVEARAFTPLSVRITSQIQPIQACPVKSYRQHCSAVHMSAEGSENERAPPSQQDGTREEVPKQKKQQPPAVDPTPPPQMMSTPPAPPPKRLDPLLASLTRMDPQAQNSNAPKTSIPLLGEVTMDQNLFIVLPIVAFAVLGFASFFLVAFESRDVFVDSMNEWNDAIMNPPKTPIDPNSCRGLCSSQDQDLEGLRSFMNKLGN